MALEMVWFTGNSCRNERIQLVSLSRWSLSMKPQTNLFQITVIMVKNNVGGCFVQQLRYCSDVTGRVKVFGSIGAHVTLSLPLINWKSTVLKHIFGKFTPYTGKRRMLKSPVVIGHPVSGSGALGGEAGPLQYLVVRRRTRLPLSLTTDFRLCAQSESKDYPVSACTPAPASRRMLTVGTARP